MVSRKAKWCGLVLALMASLRAGAELTVELPSQSLIYGEAFDLRLRTDVSDPDLRDIDLMPLREDFVIERMTGGRDDGHQSLELVLNPRRTGRLSVPSLWFAGQRSEATAVEVQAAAEGDLPLQVSLSISHADVWQRQQVLVQVQVRSRERFFQVQAEPFRHAGLTVLPLQSEAHQESVDGVDHTVRTTGWALFPQVAGTTVVELPPLEYGRGGRVQHRFALPRVTLQVAALPPYVPPDMPVGRVAIETQVKAPDLLDTGALAFWEVTVHGHGLPAASLPSPLGPVRSNDSLQFLPVQAERRQHTGSDGVTSVLRYRIPFTARRSGAPSLPALETQYFNPDSGRLVRTATPPQRLWVLAGVWRVLLVALLLIALGVAGSKLFRAGRGYLLRRRQRNQALNDILRAREPRQVRLALYRYGYEQGWRLDGSLNNWSQAFRHRHRNVDPQLDTLLAALNRIEFSHNAEDTLPALRTALAQALRKARRQRRTGDAQPA